MVFKCFQTVAEERETFLKIYKSIISVDDDLWIVIISCYFQPIMFLLLERSIRF